MSSGLSYDQHIGLGQVMATAPASVGGPFVAHFSSHGSFVVVSVIIMWCGQLHFVVYQGARPGLSRVLQSNSHA